MKYCKNCKVKVDADRSYCPLCFRELEVKNNEGASEYPFMERKKNEHLHSATLQTTLTTSHLWWLA